MKDNSNTTAQVAIETGKEARGMRKVFLKVIGISLIPLAIMGIAICLIINVKVRQILEEEIKNELRMAAYGLENNYGLIDDGDFSKQGDIIYKGDHQVSGLLKTIGDDLLENGLVCTFFYDDTRIDTTVVGISGTNMAGTKLDAGIYAELCERGEELFCEEVDLGGRIYYGYYVPYRNSNGQVKAIFFAGKLRSDVMQKVWSVTAIILWIGFAVLMIAVICSLFCSIFLVGFLFRHFKSEEETNIKKSAAKSQTEFMTLVRREVRDPIDAITVLSERILEEDGSPEIRASALGIQEAGNSMLISFNSIRDYSLLESGEISIEEEDYELTKLVTECCKKVSPGAQRKSLDFNVNYDEDMPDYLRGDCEKIRQILVNLLENAVKYTYDGSVSLDIGYRKIRADKVDVTFIVRDTGVGIRKEDAQKLFSYLGKVSKDKDVSIKGTGLGLLICRQLVNLLDGRISVDSEIGKGSTFKFTVPQNVLNKMTVGESRHNDF